MYQKISKYFFPDQLFTRNGIIRRYYLYRFVTCQHIIELLHEIDTARIDRRRQNIPKEEVLDVLNSKRDQPNMIMFRLFSSVAGLAMACLVAGGHVVHMFVTILVNSVIILYLDNR